MNRLGIGLAAGLILTAAVAEATQQGQNSLRSWKAMDRCAKQAQTAFPDFDAQSNAKRDARLKECLNGNNLPPREPLAQPGSQ